MLDWWERGLFSILFLVPKTSFVRSFALFQRDPFRIAIFFFFPSLLLLYSLTIDADGLVLTGVGMTLYYVYPLIEPFVSA